MDKYIFNLKGLIANGRIGDAIKELLALIQGKPEHEELANDLLLLSSRFNRLKKGVRIGIISHGEENVTRNQICAAYLSFLEDFTTAQKQSDHPVIQDDKISNISNKNVVVGNTVYGEKVHLGNVFINVEGKQESPKEVEKLVKDQQIIKILFIAASPSDEDRLRVDEEFRAVSEELARAKHRDRFELRVSMAARLNDLLRQLVEDPPHFIHFSGHSSKGGIKLINDKTGKAEEIRGKDLAKLFRLFSDYIACVFINSCYSEWQGTEIVKYIPKVIGMNDVFLEKTAINFSRNFYLSIGAGRDIDFAFDFAKVAIECFNEEGTDVPVLLSKVE